MTTLPVVMANTPSEHDVSEPGALLPVYKRFPVELVGGEGARLFDADGRSYLDFTSGIGVNALGYGDAGIASAVRGALESGVIHTSNLFHSAPGQVLAEALVARSFASSVFFCNSGAEANEGAFKFARRWARDVGGGEKHEIIAVRGGFHGRLFATLAATDRPQYRAPFRPLAGGISIAERDIGEMARMMDRRTVAAVIIEPVQGEGGVRVFEPAFLAALRELTRERQVALIFDEVQCGLGRTGWLFAYERTDVVPDVVTLAKPLAGGLPMGAVLVSREIAASIQPGDHGTTFGGGPFVSAVAKHVFDRLSDPALLARVRENGAWLGESLRALASRRDSIRAVRGVGYLWGIDVTGPAGEIVANAREAGLLILTAGDYTLRLLPPLIATREELAHGLDLLERALS
ncbi:MAG TPA: acetylornithine transaminase [Gemmatimonadaceae bacterium]|nr:acetylornithine transaminase [Gemmatimonadaceae bacterium]